MRINMSKLIAVLLLILIALMPATGVMSQGPGVDANGVVSGGVAGPGVEAGSCAEVGALDELSPEAAASFICFFFTNPQSPDVRNLVVLVPGGGGSVVAGRIFGSFCSGRWDITGGTLGTTITLDAVCAGSGCSGCASTVRIVVTRVPGTGQWSGTYTWDGAWTYNCDMYYMQCPF